MADTGLINSGELTPNFIGGGNGGNDRIIDGNNATFTQTYDFSGGTDTHYMHSFSGTDIPSGATINGVELIVHARYEDDYQAFNVYFGIAKDGDGTDGNASGATFSDEADNGEGYTDAAQVDNGGGSFGSGGDDGGLAVFDLTDTFSTKTFGSPTTTWAIDWGTDGLDLTNLVVKMVVAYDVSSGIWIYDFAELDLKIYFSLPPTTTGPFKLEGGSRVQIATGKFLIK